jgi:hypothetical protein
MEQLSERESEAMGDLEMVKACAEAMGIAVTLTDGKYYLSERPDPYSPIFTRYDPLQFDAQAMALVKRFRLDIASGSKSATLWAVMLGANQCVDHDLNRAIVRCVARLAGQKEGE